MRRLRKRVFFQNAAIMTVTSLLLRTIGIFFRIYVSNRVGAEGMGLYQLIVSVYVLASSFAVAGLNTAVTRLCTDAFACNKPRTAKRVLYLAVVMSVLFGAFTALLLLGGADYIAVTFLHDERAVSSLRILTISLPFMGASSCIKGYFMARRKVTSSSVAQILEQIVRIVSIVMILEFTGADGVESACFAILLGDSIAEGVSCLYMIASYLLDKRHIHISAQEVAENKLMRRILAIAAPITGGRYLNSGLRTVENVMVPDSLARFTSSRTVALEQFGKLKGMAMPLIFFPSSFLTAFTSLLIPEISEAKALSQQKRLKRTVERAIHLTLISSVLIAGVFMKLAYPLGELIYGDREVGKMLTILAPLAPVMYLESVVVGILKGLDQQTHSLVYSVIDSVSRIVLIAVVVPYSGIDGFLGVMIISNLLTCLLNLWRLCKVTAIRFLPGKWIVRPLVAIGTALGISSMMDAVHLFDHASEFVYCLIVGAIIITIYVILLPLLGCVEREDLIVAKPFRPGA